MLTAIIALSALAGSFGLLLGFAAARFKVEGDPIADRIDALLPQTQCGQCGYPGCRPYAEAIAAGEADINQCPPGGEAGVLALADLLGRDPKPLSPKHGVEKPKTVALIDEQSCIGCTLCIQACPVDAILGAPKLMHTVIEKECTGCELCVAPCLVACITMKPVAATPSTGEKEANCVPTASAAELAEPTMPCIRCGACMEVCPARLLPQQLYWHARAKEFARVQDYHLFDCTECGCCAAVCPSRIPLVQYYRFAKTAIWAQERARGKAELARRRHQFHLQRIEREKQAVKLRQKSLPQSAEDGKKTVIQAAVARVKAKKARLSAVDADHA